MITRFILPISLAILIAVILWAAVVFFFFPASETQLTRPQSLNGPYDPLIYALAYDPVASQLYAGTWGDGVFKSDDGGKTWRPWDTGLSNQARQVRVIVRASSGNRPLYAGTWLGVYRRDESDTSWRGISVGEAWFPSRPSPLEVTTLLLGDTNGDTVYAGTHAGVRKTTDGGIKWSVKDNGLGADALNIQDLAVDPDGNLYAATFGGGIYRSTDQAENWTPTTFTAQAVPTVTALVIDPNSRAIFAGTFGYGVYASNDAGQTWMPRNDGIPQNPDALKIQALAMDASGALYAGTVDHGVFKSTDGGMTWQSSSVGLEGYALSILQIAVSADGTDLYAGTYGGGAYWSGDQGKNWERRDTGIVNGALPVQALALGGAQGNWLYAGTDVGGVYRSEDGGQTWRRKNNGLPIGAARSIQVMDIGGENNRVIYIGTRAGLYRSPDGGESWKLDVVDQARPNAFVTGFARTTNALYMAIADSPAGIYRSTDAGETWNLVMQGLELDQAVSRIGLKASEDGTVYAALFGYGVYATAHGDRWVQITNLPRLVQAFDLAYKNYVQQLLWSGPRQSMYAQSLEGLYAHQDQGAWLLRFPGAVSTVLADTAHAGVVYAGTFTSTQASATSGTNAQAIFGVIISQDDGTSWKLAQPTASPVTALAKSRDSTTLYIGTLNRGVYESQVSLPPFWQRQDTVSRLGVLIFIVVLVLDLFVASNEFGVWPTDMVVALTSPAALLRLIVVPSPLTPLQQLIMAVWPNPLFGRAWVRPETIQQRLEERQASVSWAQTTLALDQLDRQHRLLSKDSGRAYRIRRPAFASIARKRFQPHFEMLAKSVREESRVYQDTRQFFQQAGFVARTTLGGLFLLSPRIETEEGVYAGVLGASPIAAREVDAFVERVNDEYHGQVEGRRAFAVVAAPPRADAYQRMAELALNPPHLHVVTISHMAIRQALAWGAVTAELARSEARAAPDADLYALEGPAVDPLDFFGRQELLNDMERMLDQERVLGLLGMPRIGKSSLLWQLKERLGNRPCIYLDLALLTGQPGSMVRALAEALATEARAWKFDWSPPDLAGVSSPADEQNALAKLFEAYKMAMRTRLPEPRLLILLDTVQAHRPIPWAMLAEMAYPSSGLQVALALDDRPKSPNGGLRYLKVMPFSTQETAELARTLLRPLESTYQADALQRLHSETAGHPQLLRQLCSEIVSSDSSEPRDITEADVAEAARRYLLGQSPLLHQIWEFLTPMEQGILHYLVNPQVALQPVQLVAEAQQALDDLEHYGLVQQVENNYRIATALMRAWLDMTFPAVTQSQ